jgi:hypothetical protein
MLKSDPAVGSRRSLRVSRMIDGLTDDVVAAPRTSSRKRSEVALNAMSLTSESSKE